jgi:hypothetical protein
MPLGTTPHNADVYTVGSASKSITITPFTFSSSCGAIVYTVTTSPSTTSIFSIDSATGTVTVFTSTPSDARTYTVTVTGTLLETGTLAYLNSNSISFDVHILDPCFGTVITTQPHNDILY